MVHERRGAGPVFLHVGLPKTGTTFLQRLLRDNRDLLVEHGVQYPVHGAGTMFHAAIEIRDSHQHWGMDPDRIRGTWDRICAEAREFDGTTVMGHEILSGATPRQVERVAADLDDVDWHVVVTARDLGRQIPAWWQEWVKDGHTTGFAETMDQHVLSGWDGSGHPFWHFQDLTGVLERWGAVLPASRMHVVVVPQSGADPQELWRRFAASLGLSEGIDVVIPPPSNESLGVTEIATLRAVNEALDRRLVQPHYGPVVKHWFVESVLSPRRSRRPVLPADWHERVNRTTDRWFGYLEETGIRVHGPLEDLRPSVAEPGERPPDDVTAEERAELAPRAMAEMLLEVSRLRRENQQLRRDLRDAERTLPRIRGAGRARRALGTIRHRARALADRSR
jgi:hypothetical protein